MITRRSVRCGIMRDRFFQEGRPRCTVQPQHKGPFFTPKNAGFIKLRPFWTSKETSGIYWGVLEKKSRLDHTLWLLAFCDFALATFIRSPKLRPMVFTFCLTSCWAVGSDIVVSQLSSTVLGYLIKSRDQSSTPQVVVVFNSPQRLLWVLYIF